jgi:hypothetical protein
MAGCLLAALTFIPLFGALTEAANPELAAAQRRTRSSSPPTRAVLVPGQPGRARDRLQTSCDIAKRYLAQSSVSYDNVDAPAGTPATVTIGDKTITPPAATVVNQKFDADSTAKVAAFKKEIGADLAAAGYPTKAKPIAFMSAQWWKVVAILTILVIYVTMVYGPIAALLVELFPTRSATRR